jgi:alpha-tubulin suppressor-like RCC1 family protein
LGRGSYRTVPVAVSGLASGVIAISAGHGHTCALTSSGAVKCWGYGYDGALGNGIWILNSKVPVDVSGLASGVKAISTGDWHTCAITSAGGAECWGSGGQVGNGAWTIFSYVPIDVSGLDSGVKAVSAGGRHTCALTTSGAVKCWGYNHYGELGNGTFTDSNVPVEVSGF